MHGSHPEQAVDWVRAFRWTQSQYSAVHSFLQKQVDAVCRKKSFTSKELDAKILQSIYFAC